MDLIDLIDPFMFLLPIGKPFTLQELRRKIAETYDVTERGDERVQWIYKQLATYPAKLQVIRKTMDIKAYPEYYCRITPGTITIYGGRSEVGFVPRNCELGKKLEKQLNDDPENVPGILRAFLVSQNGLPDTDMKEEPVKK